MVATRSNLDILINSRFSGDAVKQPMLAGDAPRPPARDISLQGLRFAATLEWSPPYVLDQITYSFENNLVIPDPMLKILPSIGREMNPHASPRAFDGTKSRSVVSPASAARIESKTQRALAGLLSK